MFYNKGKHCKGIYEWSWNISGSGQTPFNPLSGTEGPQGQPSTPFKLGDQQATDAWNEFKKLWDSPPPISAQDKATMQKDLDILRKLADSPSSDPKEQAAKDRIKEALHHLFHDTTSQNPMPPIIDEAMAKALNDLKDISPSRIPKG